MQQRALVTGAGSGIGAAVADRLRRDGWEVVRTDLADQHGVEQLDVTDEQRWDELLDAHWPIGGLVNCAGIRTRTPLIDMAVDDFDSMVSIHARGLFLGMRGAARRCQRDGLGASVVTIASTVSTHAVGGQIHYVAAKGAVASMTRGAAVELAPLGIRVNGIVPGLIRTPMTADRLADPTQLAWFAQRIPLGRPGEPGDIAGMTAFLLSDDASYITGAMFAVDGGYTAQ